MSDDARERLAILQSGILSELKKLDGETREALRESLKPGYTSTVWDGDTDLGYVQVTKPKPAHGVVDGTALGRWVEEHCPEQIVVTHSVSETWLKEVLRTGVARYIDEETGEVIEVTPDGVALVKGAPQLRVVPTAEGKALASAILRATPALGAGDE